MKHKMSGQPQPKPQQTRQEEAQQKPVNPQQQKSAERPKGARNERNERQSQNDHKKEHALPFADAKAGQKPGPGAADAWGVLPPKQAREVLEAKRREPPVAWRKAIEDYLRKLAEQKK